MNLREAEPEPSDTRGPSVALIGPNDSHRRVVAGALAGSKTRDVREFIDYPGQPSDLPRMLGQGFDVVMIDVDSDQSYALALVEDMAAMGRVRVVAYSMRSDSGLRASCLKAGADDFLPLPMDEEEESWRTSPIRVEEAEPIDAAPGAAEGQSAPEVSIAQDATDVQAAEAPLPLPLKEVSQPEPVAEDSDEWDSRFLRPARPVVVEALEAKPKPASAPEPAAKSESPLSADESFSAVVERRPAAVEKRSAVAEMRPVPVENFPAAVEKRLPAVERRLVETENFPATVGRRPVAVETRPQAAARTLIPVDWTADEPLPVGGTEAYDGEKLHHGRMKWVYISAGLGMVAGLALLAFENPPQRKATVAPPAQNVAVQAPAPSPSISPSSPLPAPPSTSTYRSPFTSTPASPSLEAPRSIPKSWKTILEASAVNFGARRPETQVSSDDMEAQLASAPRIPTAAKMPAPVEEPPAGLTLGAMDSGGSVPHAVFGGGSEIKVVPAPSAISAGVAEGLVIHKTAPVYPLIAKQNGLSGTVVVSATITKAGRVEGLRILSGSPFFRNAALDAVKNWRYKPYMLNNQPVDVQTTINVVFKMGGH